PPPSASPLFPYTTLFRSQVRASVREPPQLSRRPVITVSHERSVSLSSARIHGRDRGCPARRGTWCRPGERFSQGRVTVTSCVVRSEEHTSELQSLAYLVC